MFGIARPLIGRRQPERGWQGRGQCTRKAGRFVRRYSVASVSEASGVGPWDQCQRRRLTVARPRWKSAHRAFEALLTRPARPTDHNALLVPTRRSGRRWHSITRWSLGCVVRYQLKSNLDRRQAGLRRLLLLSLFQKRPFFASVS